MKNKAIFCLMPILTILCLSIFNISCCKSVQFHKHKFPYKPTLTEYKKKKLALVLGGGGAKGFAHLGVLEELSNAGIQPDVIIGCSAGSIVGALYADNPNVEQLKALLLPGKKSDVIEWGFADWPYGIYNISKLKEYLHKNIKAKKFSDLKVPFVATAVNLQYGNLTVFNQGEIIDPILASAAYPGVYAPVKIFDQYFVDCAVTDPVPVRVAKEMGFTTIIAVNISEQLPEESPQNGLGVLKRSLEIAYINQSKIASEQADVIIDFKFNKIGMFNDQYNYYLYEEGKKVTHDLLPLIKQKLDNS